ncbi:hypothetical protein Apa02nite_056710 [Actinoplanes palleronii]|uniref:Uncharacterized protein n=1 Tax=Actinoplanes palleronii TaxID=113570 RepID=A0ABQ4BFU9_9ACTN|nr:hypothetical protein Apa02nite_056710 [Actinoplanes palleronii]
MISIGNEANDGTGPALELLATTCSSGTCPTVFRSDRGTILIQGYAVDAQQSGVTLAPGELLVEIPAELLTAAHLAAG